ncbi:DUF2288 domain-containing protein [Congregibacter brevis]|uniref:DUF2288 domain-containing protein n=1 Tax=Congregibacter brevis TaxID=3081201 RepID=A0ABZ0ICM8_9GAMM|nr:DUF2288 domain-containing protein [Congregibacter sp. IMCC45268]
MADVPERTQRRADFLAQTARIPFSELQRYFAAGRLILASDDLDLIEVAVQLSEDNAAQFEQWLNSGLVKGVADEQAAAWLTQDDALWAVVADPWVLVQERKEAAIPEEHSGA